MAIKDSYGIPMKLDVNFLNSPLSLRFGNLGPKKPVEIGTILTVLLLGFFLFMTASKMASNSFGLTWTAMYVIGVIMLSLTCFKRDKTRLRGYRMFIPVISYWVDHKKRFVNTRGSAGEDDIMKLEAMIPLESYDAIDGTGIINYVDDTVGIWVEIIGNGQKAAFVEDRDQTIKAYDNYLAAINNKTSLTFDEKQSMQDVSQQILYLDTQRELINDPVVDAIASRKRDFLNNTVKLRFKTTHHYMSIRTASMELLREEIQLLKQQESKGLFRETHIITDTAESEALTERLREFYSLD